MSADQLHIHRPIPRRSFEITPASTDSSSPATPAIPSNPEYLEPRSSMENASPSRTRSILNLTSSTLFGIYSPDTYEGRGEPVTPGLTGLGIDGSSRYTSGDGHRPSMSWERPRTPRSQPGSHQTLGFRNYIIPLVNKICLLFAFGVAYGIIITHLHDDQRLAPVQVEGISRNDWRYYIFWGIAGVGLGSLLPWIDFHWNENPDSAIESDELDEKRPQVGSALAADWNPVVRSVGAFVGIAFAIRRLPWASTLQVSLTLALVNPVLWYLIDRSKPGFLLSTIVGLTGTAILLRVNPGMVPSPATHSPNASVESIAYNNSFDGLVGGGLISVDTIGVGTWIASVLFCSCVCFGNIGRKLALQGQGRMGVS